MAFQATDIIGSKIVGDNGMSVDWSKVVSALNRMTNYDARKAMRSVLRKAGNQIKKPVANEVKRLYPGGKYYPRNKGRKAGVLRGVKYGPLYKDVKMSVYKSVKGVNVSIFSPRKGQNRWCVLMWQNDGTNERANKRSIYTKVAKTRKKVFLSTNGNQSRGRIQPAHFFENVAQAQLNQAANYAANEFSRVLVAQYNKQ